MISQTVRAFQKMKDTLALYVLESISGVESRTYHSVQLDINSDDNASKTSVLLHESVSNKQKPISAEYLTNNLESRLYTTISSNVSSNSQVRRQCSHEAQHV